MDSAERVRAVQDVGFVQRHQLNAQEVISRREVLGDLEVDFACSCTTFGELDDAKE